MAVTEAVIVIASLLGVADGVVRSIMASANSKSRARLIKLASEAESDVRSRQAIVDDLNSEIATIKSSMQYRSGNDDAGRAVDRRRLNKAKEKLPEANRQLSYANQKLMAYNQQDPNTAHGTRLDNLQKAVEEVKLQ